MRRQSALDSKSEEVVQAALDQMIEENASGCTIMIAHRRRRRARRRARPQPPSPPSPCPHPSAAASGACARRLSTVKNCDPILCMDKGHIVESGSHEELLEKTVVKDAEGKTTQGLYRDLWETQMGTKDKGSDKKRIESLMIQVEELKWQLSAARGEKRRASLKGAIQAVKLATPRRIPSSDKENSEGDDEPVMLAPSRGPSTEAPISREASQQ